MTLAALSIAFVLSTAAGNSLEGENRTPAPHAPFAVTAILPLDAPVTTARRRLEPASKEAWRFDRAQSRPAALPALYAALGGLQLMDVYSTRRALAAGAGEANPVVRPIAGNAGAMLAVKAAATAGSIFFTERAWKKNRKGAVVLMAIINGATAAVAARNLKNAK